MDPDYKVEPYSASEAARLDNLEESIRVSKEITPLIIVIDKAEHPYVLEGGHRYDALRRMGVKSFPALVVIDKESLRAANLRTAKGEKPPLRMRFDASNPRAAAWARKHATELIDQLAKTTRQAVKDAVARAQEEGGLREQYDDILDAVGNDERATLIARTESMRAVNEGQRQAWGQAVEDGLLSDDARRTWIATADEGVCPICDGLDGAVTGLDG